MDGAAERAGATGATAHGLPFETGENIMVTPQFMRRAKESHLALFRKGGHETIAKVVRRAADEKTVDGYKTIRGYFTRLRFLLGYTPRELDRILGFGATESLSTGCDIYLAAELPKPDDFEIRGYTNTPNGISRSQLAPGADFDPRWPPGAGVVQYELAEGRSLRARHVASIGPTEKIYYRTAGIYEVLARDGALGAYESRLGPLPAG